MNPIVWQAPAEQQEQSQMQAFISWVQQHYSPQVEDYARLYTWSIHNKASFWQALWDYCQVLASQPWHQVLKEYEAFPHYQWFEGARINFAENLLRHHNESWPAISGWNERGQQASLSYSQLYDQVAKLAHYFKSKAIGKGDRVAAIMPNSVETLVAMLATTSLGAIWSSCSPDFGVSGMVDRFGQIQPKLLICCDGYIYKGKEIELANKLTQVKVQIESIEEVILVPYLSTSAQTHFTPWHLALDNDAQDIEFAQLPFDHPLYIMYSSGTTGKPKCIVHSAGGTLLQHLKELILHTDLKQTDCIFYYTTCGWMMWNWLVSSLATGAKLVLYDGSPTHPEASNLFDLAEQEKISVLGCSAKYLSTIEKLNLKPKDHYDLSSLRCILSTGSPLLPESFDYVYAQIKPDVQLCSISGGTDIISCFALGNPLLPVRRGELQGPGLAMQVEIFDKDGNAVINEKGELVCYPPFPSMPIGFWQDENHEKYRQAYFQRFPRVWAHGDFGAMNQNGGLVIYGRSDAVLNPGGVRIGTAEIYAQVDKFDEVSESIAVAQDWQGDCRIILFVVLKNGLILDEALKQGIRQSITDNTSPRHVPNKIIQVKDIPRTLSGKIVELAVRSIIHHEEVKNTSALANPEALDLFKDLPELDS